MKSVVVWDVETLPFSAKFRDAPSPAHRFRHAPRMRVACALNVNTGTFRYFLPAQADALIKLLVAADTIVSFNGKQFDLLVLRRHYGLNKKMADTLNLRHVDLHEIFSERTGFRVSLDRMAQLNLGQGKKVSGRDMAALNLTALKAACQSDVEQTYRLFLLEKAHKAKVPERRGDEMGSGPHHHLPGPAAIYRDLDTSDMTEGQLAEYLAGTWGITHSGRYVEMGAQLSPADLMTEFGRRRHGAKPPKRSISTRAGHRR
ncbi:MAG TPA: ribonuclease H-like domain-containing protein [Xanthobacteraceae bacterium]|nr:ribonuclease H-like domain-containing protein [Xanthobacteraceae bacterium]